MKYRQGKITWHTQKISNIMLPTFLSLLTCLLIFSRTSMWDYRSDLFIHIVLAPPFTAVSAQWWLWIQHRSIATIKCCSRVLKTSYYLPLDHFNLQHINRLSLLSHFSHHAVTVFFQSLVFAGKNSNRFLPLIVVNIATNIDSACDICQLNCLTALTPTRWVVSSCGMISLAMKGVIKTHCNQTQNLFNVPS